MLWENFGFPNGDEKTRSKETKGEAFFKSSTCRVDAPNLLSFNVPINILPLWHEQPLLEIIGFKSSNDAYYDLLKVANEKVEYLCMISKSNDREWWGSAPLVL